MEERFLILDLLNNVYYRDGEHWTEDIRQAWFFASREKAEQLIIEADSDSILRIVEVYIKAGRIKQR